MLERLGHSLEQLWDQNPSDLQFYFKALQPLSSASDTSFPYSWCNPGSAQLDRLLGGFTLFDSPGPGGSGPGIEY